MKKSAAAEDAFQRYYLKPVTKTDLKRLKLPCEEQVFAAERKGFLAGFKIASREIEPLKKR